VARVLHVFLKYPPAVGGGEIFVAQLAEALAAGSDHEVSVVTSDLLRHSGPMVRLEGDHSVVRGISVRRLALAPGATPRRVELAGLREAILAARPDLLHAHAVWTRPCEVAIECARELDVPLLLHTIYSDRSDEPDAEAQYERLRRVLDRLPRRCVVLVNSDWERVALAEKGIEFERVVRLPPAVDLDELAGDAPPPESGAGSGTGSRSGSPPSDRPPVVLFLGRLTEKKGVGIAIRSFAEATAVAGAGAGARLVLAGFRDSDRDWWPEIERAGLADRVEVAADLPREEVVRRLREADLLVLPSASETFGIVVAEAWATGTLPIVSDREALPYVVRDGETGLVAPLDRFADALTEGLASLGSERHRAMLAAGRRQVEGRYATSRLRRDLVALVDELLAPVT